MHATKNEVPMSDDKLTFASATRLASKIEQHWRARGFALIQASARRIPYSVDEYEVRSNIGPNGFPPRG
jgi:hypothetical protein